MKTCYWDDRIAARLIQLDDKRLVAVCATHLLEIRDARVEMGLPPIKGL